jgi:hypothetical protein
MSTTTYPLKGLSLLQPFASAIASGHKKAENRPWRRILEGPIWVALHAGKALYEGAAQIVKDAGLMGLWPDAPNLGEMPLGAILGVIRIDEILPYEVPDPDTEAAQGDTIINPRLINDRWAFGPWCWMVGEVRLLEAPMACRGAQGLFPLWSDLAAVQGKPTPTGLTSGQVEQLHAMTRRWSMGIPPVSGWYEIEGVQDGKPVLVTVEMSEPDSTGKIAPVDGTWQRDPSDNPEALSELDGLIEGARGWRVPGPDRAF